MPGGQVTALLPASPGRGGGYCVCGPWGRAGQSQHQGGRCRLLYLHKTFTCTWNGASHYHPENTRDAWNIQSLFTSTSYFPS